MPIPAKWRRNAAGVTAVALAGYIAVAVTVQGGRIVEAVAGIGLPVLLAVLTLSLLNYGLRFWRWQLYLGWRNFEIPALRSLVVYLSGFALTVSPGKAGEAVRCLYLSDEGVPYKASVALLFVERLMDLFAIVVLSAFLLTIRADLAWAIACATALLLVALAVIVWKETPAFLVMLGTRLGGRVGGLLEWIAEMLGHSRRLLAWKRLAGILLLSVVAWGVEGYGVWLLASALGHDIGLGVSLGIYGLAILAGAAAIFLPAGLGGTEAAMTALLAAAGLPVAEAIAVTLVCRLATLWFAVMIGVGALATAELMFAPGRKLITLKSDGATYE